MWNMTSVLRNINMSQTSFVAVLLVAQLLAQVRGDGISEDKIQYNPFPSKSGSFKIDDEKGIGIENEVLKQIRNEWFSSSVLADEAKAFALKQPSSHDDKTSFEEIPKERKEDLSTNDMDEFAKNISDIFTNTDIELQMGGRLQCYTCQSLNGDLSEPCWSLGNKTNNFEEFEDKFGENSPNKVTVETCKPTQRSCKVHTVKYMHMKEDSSDGIDEMTPWSIERGCDSSCEEGTSNYCVEMGARTKVLYCTSCCSDPLCNIDGKASPNTPLDMLLISQLIFIIVLYNIAV